MNTLRPWQLLMLAVFTSVTCYALVQAIKFESFMGITAAIGGTIALIVCFRIMLRMNQMEEQEQEF